MRPCITYDQRSCDPTGTLHTATPSRTSPPSQTIRFERPARCATRIRPTQLPSARISRRRRGPTLTAAPARSHTSEAETLSNTATCVTMSPSHNVLRGVVRFSAVTSTLPQRDSWNGTVEHIEVDLDTKSQGRRTGLVRLQGTGSPQGHGRAGAPTNPSVRARSRWWMRC